MDQEKIHNVKYSKEELTELAKGVFKDDTTSAVIYASEDGSFINPHQYEAKKKAGEGAHKAFVHEFKNPAFAKVVAEKSEKVTVILIDGEEHTADEIKEIISGLQDVLRDHRERSAERIGELEGVVSKLRLENSETLKERDALIVDLAELKAASASVGDATEVALKVAEGEVNKTPAATEKKSSPKKKS